MKKFITTLAVVSTLALTGVASAQSVVPGDTTGGGVTQATSTNGTTDTTNTTGATGATGTSSVGVPNTGAGGDATINYAILATSAAVAIVAGAYALRSRKTL